MQKITNHVFLSGQGTNGIQHLLVMTSIVLLAACGGGGGGGADKSGDAGAPLATNNLAPEVIPTDALKTALNSGDATALNDPLHVAQYANYLWSKHFNEQTDRLKSIMGDKVTEYIPGKSSAMIGPENIKYSQPLLVGDQGYTLASISVTEGGRGVAYGADLLRGINDGVMTSYASSFQRVLSWLVNNDANKALPAKPKMVFAGNYDTNMNLAGFKKIGITPEVVKCDFLTETACLKGIQLLVLGGKWADGTDGLDQRVRHAMAAGVPILYLHNPAWWEDDRQEQVLRGLDLRFANYGGNNWVNEKISAGVSADAAVKQAFAKFDAVRTLINDIAANKFEMNFDWSQCENREKCNDVPGLNKQLIEPLNLLKDSVDTYTKKGLNLFEQSDTELLRPLVLWADMVRKQRVFPLDKTKGPVEHKKSVIADHLVPYIRPVAITNPDLGRFMRPVTQSIPVSAVAEDVEVNIIGNKGFTAIGRLGVPGKTFTIELLEGGSANLSLFMNVQHPDSTKYWGGGIAEGKAPYTRPKHLSTPRMPLKVGKPLTIASPYGGLMQLEYTDATPNQVVKLRIKGAGKHPFLDITGGKFDSAAFAAALKLGIHDWVEVKAPNFEVHAKIELFTEDLVKVYKNDIDKFIQEIKLYLVDDVEEFAGYSIPGKSLPANVQTICTKYGWDCTSNKLHSRSGSGFIQHANVDVNSRAGDGTAGNPYDQNFPFSPRGWGESHEIGHTLQPQHFKIYGGSSTEVSNNIFPLHRNWRLYVEGKEKTPGARLPYEAVFEKIKAAQAEANKVEGANQRIWAEGGDLFERLVFYVQWVHYFSELKASLGGTEAEKEARGWGTYTMLYLHQRWFDAQTDATWAANREKLGFGTYAKKPEVNGNDHMLIMLSLLSERDQRPTFDLWGITYSKEAIAQVNAFKFQQQPAFLYVNTEGSAYSNAKKVDLSAAVWAWPLK